MPSWFRDALSGRFTSEQRAASAPAETVHETDDRTSVLSRLRWRISDMETIMLEASGDLDGMLMHRSVTDDRLREISDVLEKCARDTIPEEKA